MKISKINLQDLEAESKTLVANEKGNEQAPPKKTDFIPFGYKEEEEEPEYTKSQLNVKIDEAYKRGLEEGKQAGISETTKNVLTVEQSAEQSVKQILNSLTNALNEFESQKTAYKRDMSKLTHHVIKKVLNDKIEESSEEPILQAFEKILPIVSKEPELIIKLSNNMLEKVQTKMEKIIKDSGFKGEIKFDADPTLDDSICKVEWANNGINFDLKEKIKEIDEIINEYIKSI